MVKISNLTIWFWFFCYMVTNVIFHSVNIESCNEHFKLSSIFPLFIYRICLWPTAKRAAASIKWNKNCINESEKWRWWSNFSPLSRSCAWYAILFNFYPVWIQIQVIVVMCTASSDSRHYLNCCNSERATYNLWVF